MSREDDLSLRSHEIGQLAEHLQDLAVLGGFGRPQGVAQLDGVGGLDKKGRPAGRFVVDDPAGPVPGVPPQRDDIASVADRDRPVTSAALGGFQQGFESLDQSVPGRTDVAPGGGQTGARAVEDIAVEVE
jgi:hypothetical protein